MRTIGTVVVAAGILLAASAESTLGACGAASYTRMADSRGPLAGFKWGPAINASGIVSAYAVRDTQPDAIYRLDGTSMTLIAAAGSGYSSIDLDTTVNASGVVAFQGNPFPLGYYASDGVNPRLTIGNLFDFSNPFTDVPVINDLGQVVFASGLKTGGYGISVGDGSAIATTVVDTSGPLSFVRNPCINNTGTICFIASHDGGGGGVYTVPTAGGAPALLFNVGTPFAGYGFPAINDAGVVVFSADLAAGGKAVVKVTAPGVYTTVADTSGPYAVIDQWSAINNDGKVVFRATLDAGGLGIYSGPNPVLHKIIQAGDALDGSTVVNAHIGMRAINNAGQVVFWAKLADGTEGIYRAEPANQPPVCAAGGPYVAECAGLLTPVVLSALGSSDPDACPAPLSYTWTTTCPGATFDNPTSATPTLNVDTSCACAVSCTVSVTVSDGALSDSCTTTVSVADNTAPVLTLNAPAAPTVECHSTFTDPGVTVTEACDTHLAVVVGGQTVNPNVPGTYTITYNAVDAAGHAAAQVSRTVTVADETAPVITLNGDEEVTIPCHTGTYIELGADVYDACDTELTEATVSGSVDVNTPGTYTLTYTATDDAGKEATPVTRTVVVADSEPPVIALNGPATLTLECHEAYDEQGATVVDACDLSLTNVTVGGDTVDVNTPGTYLVTYDAEDAAGNPAELVTRTVTVADTAGPIIALNGDAAITLECHAAYVEQGAVASDACEGTSFAATIGGDVVQVDQPGVYVVTYDATDAAGNAGTQVTRTVTVVDGAPPVITVNTAPITAQDSDCSGSEAVTLPTATAADLCDGAVTVTNNAPAVFPVGQTVVTYTATDSAGNTATAQVTVTVAQSTAIAVEAIKWIVGVGSHPGVTQVPLAGITVGAYPKGPGTCARQHGGTGSFLFWPQLIATCTPLVTAVTDAQGRALLNVPAGDYFVLTHFDSDGNGTLDEYLGSIENNIRCGETQYSRLRLIQTAKGKQLPTVITRLIGSELLIVEPAYVVWDETEQLYPFVFESVGDWNVVASVAPPEGFVADHDELSAEVLSDVKAVQFTVTEIGSDLVPTKTSFQIDHKGRRQTLRKQVDIRLTEKYARSRGFDPAKLKAKGLIAEEKPGRKLKK